MDKNYADISRALWTYLDGLYEGAMADETTATAKLDCAIPPRYFSDYPSLLKLDGGRRIVSKSFPAETHQ